MICVLSKGQKFNIEYFRDEILAEIFAEILAEIQRGRPTGTGEDGRRSIVLHYDNARPHTTRRVDAYLVANQMTRVLHLVFSPDLASSDFYLFGKLKAVLNGSSFENKDEPFGM
jgi:hypothetical protein